LAEVQEKTARSKIRVKSDIKHLDVALGQGEDFSYDEDTSIKSKGDSTVKSLASQSKMEQKLFTMQSSESDRFTASQGQIGSPQVKP
jgi:hypothetical protein